MQSPFVVIATQNPKGSAGTQLLPESQLDRFMICMSMGYPDAKSEIEIARGKFLQGEAYEVLLELLKQVKQPATYMDKKEYRV